MGRPTCLSAGRFRAQVAVGGTPLRSILVALLALVVSGCSYTLVGRGAFIPEYIETVAIPTFVNRTTRFEVEIRLTDEVTREFVSRGNYQVVAEPQGADAVLRGEILRVQTRPIGLDPDEEVRNYQVEITAAVTFTDLVQNQVLFTNNSFLFRQDFVVPEDPSQLIDLEIIAVELIARDFARSVVSSILEGF